jgi:hypothetical protein
LGMNAARMDLFGQTAELVRERLAHYGTGPDRFGLAHCDLRLSNLLLHHGALKVIDFDDCGFGWYMYDAAASLSFYEHLPQVSSLVRGLSNRVRNRKGRGRRDSYFPHAAPLAAGSLGRVPLWNQPGPIAGCVLHPADGCSLYRLSAALRMRSVKTNHNF